MMPVLIEELTKDPLPMIQMNDTRAVDYEILCMDTVNVKPNEDEGEAFSIFFRSDDSAMFRHYCHLE
jgi:hypothetical protein